MEVKNNWENGNSSATEVFVLTQSLGVATDRKVIRPADSIKEYNSAFHRVGGKLNAATTVTVEYTIFPYDVAKQDEDGGSRVVWVQLGTHADFATFKELLGPIAAFRITITGSVAANPAQVVIAFG